MWKWFLLLWIVQWRTLLSQPVISENIRESRQLNFDECCPCSGRSPDDHDGFDATLEQETTANSCPCMSTSDSEPASSIFSPVLRAAEPFTRSAKERNPKPLLNPEVGLASSVLETLREVTDQEYQEALERDAARNALRDMEYNLLGEEKIDTPRNIVNIILQPKEGLADDPMPEASHTQETRCIHPLSEMSNSYNKKKFKPSNKPLRGYLPMAAPRRGNKYFDMENSPSNVQEQVLKSTKTNILEDLKSKSDLLKMKLLSSSKNGLKGSYAEPNTPNLFNREPDCDNFYNNRASRVPNFKLGSILDLLKTPAEKRPTSLLPIMKETEKDQENDFTLSPSNLKRYYIRNNEPGYYTPNNGKLSLLNIEEKPRSTQMAYPNEISVKDKFFETEKYSTLDQPETKLLPFTETGFKNDNKLLTKVDETNNNVIFFNKEGLKNTKDIDAVPSASELNIVQKPVGEIIVEENSLNKECEIGTDPSTTVSKDETKDVQEQTFIEETIPNILDKTINEENDESITNSEEDLKNKSTEEIVCDANDLETDSSNDNIRKTNTPQENNKELNFDNESIVNTDNSLSATTNKAIINDDFHKTNKVNTLPSIRTDILKTLQNVKKANERFQEKLKSNVKNAFKSENVDEAIESTTLYTPTSKINGDNGKKSDDINTQDLQEMSDRILNLSLSKERVVDPVEFDSKSIINKESSTIEKTDNYMTTSELNNIEISTISSLPITEPMSTLSYSPFKNVDEIVDVGDKAADNKQDNDNNDTINSVSGKLCENIVSKDSDKIELISSNDGEKEMVSEASSPYINSIPHTSGNIIAQPNSNRDKNIEEFLNNVKSSISDIFNNNRDLDRNTQNGNEYNSNRNSMSSKNNQQYNFNAEPFSDRQISSVNSYSKGLAGGDLFKSNKNNNLNSYKAKVAIPESLDIKTIPSLKNGKEERLQKSLKDNPEITSASNALRSYLEKPNYSRLTNYRDNALNNYEPRFNLQIPHQNSFSESLKSRTDQNLKNIQESFDDLRKSQGRNHNNRLDEYPKKPNIFGSLQQNDLSKRLQDFNSDIMDRLTLMSQRIQSNSQSKSNKNNVNSWLKSNQKFKPQLKDNILLKSKQTPSKPNTQKPVLISSSKKSDISKPYPPKKSDLSLDSRNGNLRNTEYPTKFRNGFETKSPLKKENKVTFSFSTTIRPEKLKLGSNSKILNKPTPTSLRSSIDFSKSTSKSPLQKRLELMSKLKPGEPKSSASNQFTSRLALPNRKLDNSVTTTSSSLEDSILLFGDKTNNPERGFTMKNEYTPDNMILSKFRDTVKAKSNSNMSKKFLDSKINNLKSSAMADATQSASNNIDLAVLSSTEKPLKENVSYKCKMICYEDKDSK